MPQDTIFPTSPRSTGISITMTEVPAEGGQAYNLVVQEHMSPGGPCTRYAARWSGYMLDLTTTFCEDVMHAWLYGGPGDISKAAASVQKVARAHSRRHDR